VFLTISREWIMAAIVTGTVVLWKVVDPGPDERVKHEGDEAVKVFVPRDETGDDVADAQVVAIMSQFLLTKLGKEKEGEEPPLSEVRRLLKKGRGGLLQRQSVKPPPPSTDE
jgi:hypothetical protein